MCRKLEHKAVDIISGPGVASVCSCNVLDHMGMCLGGKKGSCWCCSFSGGGGGGDSGGGGV